MKRTGKITGIIAATAVLGMLVSASASAEDRHRDGTWRDNGAFREHSRRDGGFRNETRNNHVFEHGRIRNFSRERDGYRVWLDRDDRPYWIPFSRLGSRRLRVGLDLRLGGIFNGGYVAVDTLGWPGDPYYADPYYAGGAYYGNRYDGYLIGRVERVDYRYGTLLLRDGRSGRMFNVDIRSTHRGRDFDDIRAGERIRLSGSWDRGHFRAHRVDGFRRY